MRIRISKSKGGYTIRKETTTQSILSDVMTILVLIVAIGLDALFSIYITHLVVLDVVIVVSLLLWAYSISDKREITKEQLLKELEN